MKHLILLAAMTACVSAPVAAEVDPTMRSTVINNLIYAEPDANCKPMADMVSYLMGMGFNVVDYARDRNQPSTLAVFHHRDLTASIVVVSDIDHVCIIAGY